MAGICDVPIISNVCDTVGETAATLISAPFDWLAQAIGQAASWLFQGVWALFDSTTFVDLGSDGYVGVYNVIFGIGIFLMLIFFCLQLITGLIRRDPGSLGRAALGLARSVLGSFLVITLTTTLLEVVDQLSIGIVQATGTTLEEMGGKIGVLVAGLTTINLTAPGAGAIITIFLSFLAICAAAIVWFSLLIRKALILVAVVMAPIALSGQSWDATRGWFGKWASFLLALIFSKLVIVVVFLVAINQVNAPIDMDLSSIADPIAGIVLMFIAAFAPYMVYKFISFVGFDMYHVMSAEQESKQAMNRPMPLPGKPEGPSPQKVLDGGGGGAGGGNPPPPGGGPGPSTAMPGAGGGGAATAGAAGGASGGAAGGGAAAGGAAGAGAAAGPIGVAAVAGAKIAKGAAEAGPKLGGAIGGAADAQANAASEGQTPPPPDQSVPSAPPPAPAGGPSGPSPSSPSPQASPARTSPTPPAAPPPASPPVAPKK